MKPKSEKTITTEMPFTHLSLEADRDYLLARFISFLGGAFASRAGYFAQAACEKYMKAFTIQEAKHYLGKHVLLDIADTCLPFDPYFGEPETRRVLQQFDKFEQVGRYGAAVKFDPLSARTPEMQTAGVWTWHQSYLSDLDAFVFKVRNLLRFDGQVGMDMLSAILANDNKNYFVATWTGPPLLNVLTVNNRYFVPVTRSQTE